MSKRTSRGRRRTPAPVHSPLARLLDAPHLARVVPHLAPETLHQLIRRTGLDACGELVACATPDQLTSVLDLDLWRHSGPGRDERFDADRFGEWLEMLVEAGETVAARIVASLDEHLVIAGLSRYVRVFDLAAIAPPSSIDDELIDRDETPPGSSECEVGGYLVRAIRPDAWDAIIALLLALDTDHRDCFHTVMLGCRRLSNSAPEVDGLDDLLMEPEQLFDDVALDREQRRSQQGYSTPADARAFLHMARQRRHPQPDGTPSMNPIVRAYFRTVHDIDTFDDRDASRVPRRALGPASTDESIAESIDVIVGLLAEAGPGRPVAQQPRALLEGARPEQSRLTCIRPLMEYVRETDDAAHLTRSKELMFLANTLMAGCSVQSRPFTAQEASDAVLAICNLGLEHWPARWSDTEACDAASTGLRVTLPDAFLVGHDLVMAFEVGWAALYEDVSMFVAEHLIAALGDLQCVDEMIQDGLDALRRELVQLRSAGTPWQARDALDVLTMLDMPAWASLLGLLDECPVMPAALTASLEGRIGAVSATAFEFISTTRQVDEVRAYMKRLPDTLRR